MFGWWMRDLLCVMARMLVTTKEWNSAADDLKRQN